MNIIAASIVATFAIAASPSMSTIGWNGAGWGMTPQQVEEATNGFARMTRDSLPREGRDPVVGSRAEFENATSEFELQYFYDHDGLTKIELTPNFEDCEAVLQTFVESFGQPEYHEQVILRNFVWIDEENDNRIVLTHSTADMCRFLFHSLSEFRELEAARTN